MLGHGAVGELALGEIPGSATVIVKSASDTLAVSLTEAASYLVWLNRTDALDIVLGDVSIAVSAFLSRSDALNVTLSESADILASLFRLDHLTVSLDEVVDILAHLERSDEISPYLLDEFVRILAALERADALDVSLVETCAILASLIRSDSIDVALADRAFLTLRNRPTSATFRMGVGDASLRFKAVQPSANGGVRSGSASVSIRH